MKSSTSDMDKLSVMLNFLRVDMNCDKGEKMSYSDEKDYIMRIIKEMVRVLCSLMLGKQTAGND